MQSRLLQSLAILCFFFVTSISYAAPSTEGLVAYWRFDGTDKGVDLTGNGHDGTLRNDASYATTPDGFGHALYVDGSDAAFSVPDHADLDFSDTMTINVWINPQNQVNSSWAYIISKWLRWGETDRAYNVFIKDNNQIGVGIITTLSEYSGYHLTHTSWTVTHNQWQQVTVVFADSNLSLHLNGQFLGQMTTTGTILNNSNELLFGALPHGTVGSISSDYAYTGYIDEVKLFNRALTPSDIEEEYLYALNGFPQETAIPEPVTVITGIASLLGIAVNRSLKG